MKGICLQWRLIGCARFLLFASLAAGQIAANPSSVNFGSVQVGSTSSQSTVVSNISSSKVQISQATVSGTNFSISGPSLPINLSPGQSVTFSFSFGPQSAVSSTGSVSLVSKNVGGGSGKNNGASNSTTMIIPVSGTGVSAGQLAANPTSVSFSAQTGTSQTLSQALTNSGGSSVTVSQATLTGSGFSISGLNLPFTLPAGQTYTFSVTFAPTASGTVSGSISVASDASDPTLLISLSGTGTSSGQLTVSPSGLNFGTVTVGSSVSQTGTLSATGSSVTVSSASLSNSEFALSGLSLPLTLAAGQSVPFTMTFAPQTSGTASGTAGFASNASNAPTSQSLTGSGGTQHSVNLSWVDSSAVAGYNIYRGGTSGGPYTKINSALDATTAYTDSTVQAGQTYYYVTTAMDSSGTESAYSNEVQAVIPSP